MKNKKYKHHKQLNKDNTNIYIPSQNDLRYLNLIR